MIYNSILDPEMPSSGTQDGHDNKGVQACLQLIQSNYSIKTIRDNKNLMITTLMEAGFDVADPQGARKITAQMLQQAMWRTMNKFKPLDFQIQGNGRPPEIEEIVTFGVETVMKKGGYITALRDKQGVGWNMFLYGDGMYMIFANPDDNSAIPIKFLPIQNSNIYVDNYCSGIRSGSMPATQMCVIFSMSWGEACKLYPKMKKVGGPGQIPRQIQRNVLRETGRSYLQQITLNDITEIAYFWDIRNKRYTAFGGAGCTVLEDEKGKNYPFVKDEQPYIPVGQFMCMPSAEGFWNHGLGDMLYRLAIITRQMMNMSIGHAEDSVYPITLVNVPQGEASKFFNNLKEANKARSIGKKPIVSMEYDPNNPNSGRVSAQSLVTQSLLAEWQSLYEQINREIRRLGINLDDIEKGDNVTATQIMAEEENSNAFVKQVMEYNAGETQFAVELTMDFMKKFIKKNNKTLINLPTRIKTGEGQDMKFVEITLGMVADELKKHDYYVDVNARTGAIPSNIMEQTQLSRMLQVTPPGTPAWEEIYEELAVLNGRDLTRDMVKPPAPPMAPGGMPGAPGGAEASPMSSPSETDRLAINPSSSRNPVPAF